MPFDFIFVFSLSGNLLNVCVINFLTDVPDLCGENKQESIPDCPVCLQACTLPVKLVCGHIFCFLCIKGVAFRSRRCALCRQDVDLKYFDNPEIVHFETKTSEEGFEELSEDTERYQWYYEGRNGWWQYEELSSAELEKAHKDGKRSCELLIAGFLYFVDFDNMVQFRKTEPGRRRRIKRDVIDAEKKGVAGLRLGNQRPDTAPNNTPSDRPSVSDINLLTPVINIQRLVIGSDDDGDDGNDGSGNNGQVRQRRANRNS